MQAKTISVHDFKIVLDTEQDNQSVEFINVCTPQEYQEGHIEGVTNMPLDSLSTRVDELKDKQTIYIHCRSGNRGEKAIAELQSLGVAATLVNVTGGIMAWHEAGHPTRKLTNRLPLMRQVFIAAGLLVLSSVGLSVLVAQAWVGLAAFVGAGLVFAGVTGWCGMSKVLAVMPWNKA